MENGEWRMKTGALLRRRGVRARGLSGETRSVSKNAIFILLPWYGVTKLVTEVTNLVTHEESLTSPSSGKQKAEIRELKSEPQGKGGKGKSYGGQALFYFFLRRKSRSRKQKLPSVALCLFRLSLEVPISAL